MKLMNFCYFFFLGLILCNLISCNIKQKEVLYNQDFNVVKQVAIDRSQNFCVVLLDTTNLTSRIYLERLRDNAIQAVFNIVNLELPSSHWYKQWLFSNSDPVTCIFAPSGNLIDIIPGASRKCLRCIKQVVDTGTRCSELSYYNNFFLKKEQLIPVLDNILQCKYRAEKGLNIESQISLLLDSINYPYGVYLGMMNFVNHGEYEKAKLLAKQLLSFNNDLDLEIYPELQILAKGLVDPNYNSKAEPKLECVSQVLLSNCEKNVPRRFELEVNNSGESSLKIQEVQLSCSCINLVEEKTYIIPPHKSQNIKLEFTANKAGRIVREIVLRSNGIYPITRIKIVTNVSPSKGKEA